MFVSILEVADILMLRSPIFEDLYSPELDSQQEKSELETDTYPSLNRDGLKTDLRRIKYGFFRSLFPSLNRDGNRDRIISVSNQRPKNPSLIRDGIFGL